MTSDNHASLKSFLLKHGVLKHGTVTVDEVAKKQTDRSEESKNRRKVEEARRRIVNRLFGR